MTNRKTVGTTEHNYVRGKKAARKAAAEFAKVMQESRQASFSAMINGQEVVLTPLFDGGRIANRTWLKVAFQHIAQSIKHIEDVHINYNGDSLSMYFTETY